MSNYSNNMYKEYKKMQSKKDLIILSHLRQNSREPLTIMSRNTTIPVSTIFDRIKAHQQDQLITRFTALLDFPSLGYPTRVHVMLKVHKDDRDNVRQTLLIHKHVNSAYRISNGYDYLIEGIFETIKDVENFLEHLEEHHRIQAKQVYYIIDDLKREAFLSNPEYVKITYQAEKEV